MDIFTLAIIGLIGGGLVGLLSQDAADRQWNREAQQAIEDAGNEKTRQLNYLDESWELSKEKAGREADRQDLQTTVSESLAAGSLATQMESLSLHQVAFGENLNAAEMNAGASYGSDLASLAASGTRSGTGSMAAAVDMQAAVNAAQLESQKESGRKGSELDLSGILNNLSSTNFGLQQSRDVAAQLRADYEEGGLAYKDYQLQRKKTEEGYDAEISRLERQKEEFNSFDSVNSRWFSSLFHGATTGASLAYNVAATGREEGWWNLA